MSSPSAELLESINSAQDAVRDENVLSDNLAVAREIRGAAAWHLQNSFCAIRNGMGDIEVHRKLNDAHVACDADVCRLLVVHIRAVAYREEALDAVRFFTARDIFRAAARAAARAALDRAPDAPLALAEARAINYAVRFERDSHQDANRDLLAAGRELLSASNSHAHAVTRHDEAVRAHHLARRDDELALNDAATAAFYSADRVFGTCNFLEVRAVTRSVLASEAVEEANLSLVLAKDNRVKSARAARCADLREIDAWDMVGILLARRKNAHRVLRAAITVRREDAVRARRDALGL